jgi:hypothetical protein
MSFETSIGKEGTGLFRLEPDLPQLIEYLNNQHEHIKRSRSRKNIFLSLKNINLTTMNGICGINLMAYHAF